MDELTEGLLTFDSKTGRGGDPEDDRFLRAGILQPMLFFCRQIETLPRLQLEDFFSKSKGQPSSKHVSEFLPFMGTLFGGNLPLAQGEKNGLETPIRRARNQELESLYLFLLDGDAIVLPVHYLFLSCGITEELGNVLIESPQDLNQAVQRDGCQIPFDLGDEPLGQSGPLCQLLLSEIA